MAPAGAINGRAIAPFVQLVVGAVRTDADLIQNGSSFHAADWAFMLQPGGGVTVPLSSMLGLVGQVDYRRAFFSQSENELRFLVGVRLNPR